MIIPFTEVLGMRQQYATVSRPAYHPGGYLGQEPALRLEAYKIFAETFAPYPIDPEHITISCLSIDGDPGEYVLTFRASWDPPMDSAQLTGGNHHGWKYPLGYPKNTVTFRSNVGPSEQYKVHGFDTETGAFVFAVDTLEKVA